MFVPIVEWAPDADNTAQGVLADVENMVPTLRGYSGAPSPISTGLAALAAECRNAATVTLLDETSVLFAGTQTKLYKAGSSSWTDVTRVSSDYTGSVASRWCYTQQGNVTFAVNKVDNSQYYLHGTSTDFADLAGMPKALVVEAAANFVLIGNYNDGSDVVDGWGCSALGDYTDWTASTTTLCTYGRLMDTPGPITGLKRLMDYAVYYKRKSMYLARYVGQPDAWQFSLVSDVVGAVSNDAVVLVGTQHFFLGDDNFYSYDSASVKPIGDSIKEWFNRDCNNAKRHLTQGLHDKRIGLVWWFYPSGTSTTPDSYVVFNYRTGKWGKGTQSVECAVQYVAPGASYDDLNTMYGTYNAIPNATYDDLNPSGLTVIPAVINTSHALNLLTGSTTACDITSNDFGSDSSITLLSRVRPRYLTSATGSMTNYYRDSPGDSLTTGQTVSGGAKFDVLRSARWHRFKIEWTSDVEVTGADVTAQAEGAE